MHMEPRRKRALDWLRDHLGLLAAAACIPAIILARLLTTWMCPSLMGPPPAAPFVVAICFVTGLVSMFWGLFRRSDTMIWGGLLAVLVSAALAAFLIAP